MKCIFTPPLWLLIINWIGWGLGSVTIVIALVFIVEQIAIKENAFTRKNKIILIIMSALLLIGLITTIYLRYKTGQVSPDIDC